MDPVVVRVVMVGMMVVVVVMRVVREMQVVVVVMQGMAAEEWVMDVEDRGGDRTSPD